MGVERGWSGGGAGWREGGRGWEGVWWASGGGLVGVWWGSGGGLVGRGKADVATPVTRTRAPELQDSMHPPREEGCCILSSTIRCGHCAARPRRGEGSSLELHPYLFGTADAQMCETCETCVITRKRRHAGLEGAHAKRRAKNVHVHWPEVLERIEYVPTEFGLAPDANDRERRAHAAGLLRAEIRRRTEKLEHRLKLTKRQAGPPLRPEQRDRGRREAANATQQAKTAKTAKTAHERALALHSHLLGNF